MVSWKEINKKYNILVVDDEPLIRESLYEILRIEGYHVQMAPGAPEALKLMSHNKFDVVVTDYKLSKMSGMELLEAVKKDSPETEVVMITGYGSIETAVEAMKKGARDYITKPINDNEFKIIIQKTVENKDILEENKTLKEMLAREHRSAFGAMIGASEKMQSVYRIIDSVASTNATILIAGESGTGKGLIAKAIHENDKARKDKPFIEVSCGALSETLLESELFGHVKGAFTGAIKDKEGRFEYADGGTVFLDEIDAFSLNLQVKLLRVLQDGVFERVGDNVTRKTHARIIVATNQVLTDLVEAGKFREDLFYRVNVIAIQAPPLRDRKDDIGQIAAHFLEKYSRINNKKVDKLSDEVIEIFRSYYWPGNVRELENAIEGAVIMAKTETVHKDDIPNISKFIYEGIADFSEKTLKKAVEEPEREHIISVLNDCNWNRNRAAEVLGVNRTTLYNKMKKYNIFGNAKRSE
ncbi:MAG: sigma-54-dependent Fis family transcriptional regulator [Candidatus Omnitrophica bacterium]|nr:sigma-54-dependent Fis family transcriptional regulator [Candidatus Omnitrophota bacterium]